MKYFDYLKKKREVKLEHLKKKEKLEREYHKKDLARAEEIGKLRLRTIKVLLAKQETCAHNFDVKVTSFSNDSGYGYTLYVFACKKCTLIRKESVS